MELQQLTKYRDTLAGLNLLSFTGNPLEHEVSMIPASGIDRYTREQAQVWAKNIQKDNSIFPIEKEEFLECRSQLEQLYLDAQKWIQDPDITAYRNVRIYAYAYYWCTIYHSIYLFQQAYEAGVCIDLTYINSKDLEKCVEDSGCSYQAMRKSLCSKCKIECYNRVSDFSSSTKKNKQYDLIKDHPEVKTYLQKLQTVGYLNEDTYYSPKVDSDNIASIIAFIIGKEIKIRNYGKYFESLWGIKNISNKANKVSDEGKEIQDTVRDIITAIYTEMDEKTKLSRVDTSKVSSMYQRIFSTSKKR